MRVNGFETPPDSNHIAVKVRFVGHGGKNRPEAVNRGPRVVAHAIQGIEHGVFRKRFHAGLYRNNVHSLQHLSGRSTIFKAPRLSIFFTISRTIGGVTAKRGKRCAPVYPEQLLHGSGSIAPPAVASIHGPRRFFKKLKVCSFRSLTGRVYLFLRLRSRPACFMSRLLSEHIG